MRQKKQVVLVEAAPQEKEEDLTPAQEQAQEKELVAQEQAQEWLADFQSRFSDQPVRILVEKYDESGDWALCHKYPLSSFDQETVRAEYGNGKYRGTLFDPQGKYIKDGRVHFKFAESTIKPPIQQKPENPLENPVVLMIIESLKGQQATMLELVKSMVGVPGAAGPKASGLGEIVEVVKSLNSMAPKEKPLDNFKETLNMMKLVREVTGDAEGESKGGLLSEIREFLEVYPMIKEQLAQIKPPAIAATATAPAATTQPTDKAKTMDPLTKKIVELVPKFVGGARANGDIKQWGQFLLDVFDAEVLPILLPVMKEKYKALVKDEDDAYDIVLRLAQDPEERAGIYKQIPPLAPHETWCNQIIEAAILLAQDTGPIETQETVSPTSSNGDITVVLEGANPTN